MTSVATPTPSKKFHARLFQSSHELKPSVHRRAGMAIITIAIIALVWSNLPDNNYLHVWEQSSGILGLTRREFVDKGIMSIFFFAAGMELRYEFAHGSMQKAGARKLPVYCALGGMCVPLVIMLIAGGILHVIPQTDAVATLKSFPVPIATDTVFALTLLSFFSSRIPKELRSFILAFAVIDDLGGLIALFFLQGSLSPTVVAVIAGFLIPGHIGRYQLRTHLLAKSTLVVTFFVLPIFALVNAGVTLEGMKLSDIAGSPLFWTLIVAQYVGKIVGVYIVGVVTTKKGWALLPRHCTRQHMFVAASVAAIGFTLSLYLAEAALEGDEHDLVIVKLAVILASVIAAISAVIAIVRIPRRDEVSS